MVTGTDFFCGAGGSSTGLVAAGVKVKMAANHWKLAIDTHNTNHPDTDHDLADLRATHPSRYPHTDIAWFSPECTNHSLAKGKKRKGLNQLDLWGENKIDPAEERSRATMREVVEFSDYHRYPIVIVENVVDIRYWQHYQKWMQSMLNLGYDCKVLYLNSQFFGVPQSRDRFYAVFWQRGNKAPDLNFRPDSFCSKCETVVHSIQGFKKPDFAWGRYGKGRQYLYRCPVCGSEVMPGITPAYSVIDWSLPAERIGDRTMPLKPKTLERIRAGLKKFARTVIVDTSFTHDSSAGKVRAADEPMMTQTTRQSLAVAVPPFMAIMKNSWSPDGKYTLPPRGIDEALTTIVASASQHALITPPLLSSVNNFDDRNIPVDEPMATQTTASKYGLVIPPLLLSYFNNDSEPRPADEPLYCIATSHNAPVVIPPYLMSYYSREDAQSGVDAPMPVIPTNNRHSLIIPPFISTYNKSAVYAEVDKAMPTITGVDRNGLTIPPFVVSMRQHTQATAADAPLSTITAGAVQHVLVEPADLSPEDVEALLMASSFRMLEPKELKLGMSFPGSYIVLGNKRDQVKQIGNAVCCNVARWIAERCVEALQ